MAVVVAALLLVLAPVAGAVVAVRFAPPGHASVAGQSVAVKPVIGRDTTVIQGGAIVRPEHAHVGLLGLGTDIGLDLSLDWNRLIPQDKQTRAYLTQLFDDPAPAMAEIREAARTYVVRWAAIGFGTVLAIEIGGVLLVRQRRRRLAALSPEVAGAVTAYNARLRTVVAASCAVALVSLHAVAAHVIADPDERAVVGSPFFNGTALAGTEVNGLVAEVVPFLSVLEPHSAFYDKASDNLDAALGGTDLRVNKDDVLFIAGEDLEDVNGMARIMGRAAKLTGADFIAYSGDLTFAGKAIESYLLDTIDYYSDNVPVEFAPGLHDTPEIVRAADARGWRVADNRTHDVQGISLLSLADPRVSTVGDFGSGTVEREDGVGVPEFLDAATREACSTKPDIVLLHDHLLGARLAQQGCQTAMVLDGRSYRLIGAQEHTTDDGRTSLEYTQGSAGGHVTTAPNPGDIQHPATFEAFSVNPDTKALHVSVFTVRPDASVQVSSPVALP
ncbi:hypothetical protein [Nocardioides sp. CER19]|uniref:hypothetical protein n=1 Tax=Nocardioides sp. CER19 TaxID=3038538 RepID=UPI00244A3A00|nr:hypothetical protein [Nocardioides sp. CER19]MDH2413188.1 hypothetical protein [Nocardioides sp. CER19]